MSERWLLDVKEVAATLGCSVRHVYRMVDREDIPQPVKLGSLVRWPRQVIDEWIKNGCKPSKRGRK